MNTKADNNKSRNVTPKGLIQATFVIVVIVILFWYKESGSKTAALVFAAVPVISLLYYLKLPAEERRKTEQGVKAELRRSKIGGLWIGFFYLVVFIADGLLLRSFDMG